MKQVIYITILFFSLSISAQEIKMGTEIVTCESGTENAVKDFEKGIYNVYTFGLITQINDRGFESYYKNYLFKTYGIKLIHKGCLVMPNDECYTNKMTELLYEKHGKDLFEVARKDARTKFDKTKD